MASKLLIKVLFWLGFALSFLTAIITGLEMSFNVYALPMKETFNFSQTQIEVIASMSSMGLGLGFLELILTGLFGFKTTCIISCLGMIISSSLIALFAHYNRIFSSWPSLVGVMQLILSTLNNVGFLATSGVCVKIIPKHHTGKLVSFYLAATCFAKIYYGGLFEVVFNNNIPGFFLFVSISTIPVCVRCALLHPFTKNENLQCDLGFSCEETIDKDFKIADTSFQEMLKSSFFNITLYTSIVFFGCVLTCLNNITAIAESVGMADPLYTVFIMSCVIFITRMAFGALFDTFSSQWFGFAVLIISSVSFCVSMLVCMFFVTASLMSVTAALIGVGVGTGSVAPVAIILRHYGRSHYIIVTSCLFAGASICQTLLQLLLGFLYDLSIIKISLSGRDCYGRHCFYWICLVMLCMTLFIIVLQIINFTLLTLAERRNEEFRQSLKGRDQA